MEIRDHFIANVDEFGITADTKGFGEGALQMLCGRLDKT